MWFAGLCVGVASAGFPAHDAPFKSGHQAPADAGVVIGIEDYFALPDVPHADRDARAVEDLMIYTLGVPTSQVIRVDSPASKERIEKALDQAADLVGTGGTLWVYFAGHGAASPSSGERLLLGADTLADADSFEARSVSLSDIKKKTVGAGRAVLMVDACYSGASRAGGELLPGKRFAVPSYAMPAESSWIEWHAAKPDQLSGPLDVARHGAFTWAMVGALRGWADGQLDDLPDGKVTVVEAQLYVESLLRTVGVTDQEPVLKAKTDTATLHAAAKLEARPDDAALRAQAAGHVAAPAPANQTAGGGGTSTQPAETAPTGWGLCTDLLAKDWWAKRAWLSPTVPYSAWSCDGGKPGWNVGWLAVYKIPPQPGRSMEEVVRDELIKYPKQAAETREQGGVAASYGPYWEDADPHDVQTWRELALRAPSGEVTARYNKFSYYMPTTKKPNSNNTVSQDWMVVEDPRMPGSVLACWPWSDGKKRFEEDCGGMLQGMLAQPIW